MSVLTKGYLGSLVMVGAGATFLVALTMVSTTPRQIGPFGVTLWFIGVLAVLVSLVAFVSYLVEQRLRDKVPASELVRNSARRGFLVGIVGTTLLALSSLKQINLRDALLLVLLVVLVEFYVMARA